MLDLPRGNEQLHGRDIAESEPISPLAPGSISGMSTTLNRAKESKLRPRRSWPPGPINTNVSGSRFAVCHPGQSCATLFLLV